MARNYSSVATEKTLSSDVPAASGTITLNNLTGLPSFPYALVINPDTTIEEIVVATSISTGTTLNVTRAAEASSTASGSTAKDHSQGNVVRHMITARDLQDSADHIAAVKNVHGISNVTDNGVVGIKDAQVLTNKTLTSPTITSPSISTPTFAAGVSGSLTISSTELGYLDGTTGNLQTQLDAKAPIANPTLTGTVTLPSTTSIGTVSSTELGYLDGVTSSIQAQINNSTLVGSIVMWAAVGIPTGWLECNGQSTTGYPALADAVGANVPDLQGRVPVGFKTSDTDFGTLLGTGGNIATQAHSHGVTQTASGSHTASGSASVSVADHGHTLVMAYSGTAAHDHAISGITNPLPAMQSDGAGANIGNNNGTAVNGGGGHTANGSASVTVANHTHTISIDSFGGGVVSTAVNGNLQPYITLKFIIKF